MKLSTLLAASTLAGCAAYGSAELAVACQAADAATTIAALHRGAVELNPLMSGLLHAVGAPGLILVKAGIAWIILAQHESMTPVERYVTTTVSCLPAISNAAVLAK